MKHERELFGAPRVGQAQAPGVSAVEYVRDCPVAVVRDDTQVKRVWVEHRCPLHHAGHLLQQNHHYCPPSTRLHLACQCQSGGACTNQGRCSAGSSCAQISGSSLGCCARWSFRCPFAVSEGNGPDWDRLPGTAKKVGQHIRHVVGLP